MSLVIVYIPARWWSARCGKGVKRDIDYIWLCYESQGITHSRDAAHLYAYALIYVCIHSSHAQKGARLSMAFHCGDMVF